MVREVGEGEAGEAEAEAEADADADADAEFGALAGRGESAGRLAGVKKDEMSRPAGRLSDLSDGMIRAWGTGASVFEPGGREGIL